MLFGRIIVSNNYVADKIKLIEALTEYEFGDDNSHACLDDRGRIQFPDYRQYPDAQPSRTIFIKENGEEFTKEEYQQDIEPDDIIIQPLTLDKISKEISPLITEGVFEITAIWTDRNYGHFSNLKIHSTGKVELTSILKSQDDDFYQSEVYLAPQ